MTEVTERLKQAAADRVDALRDTICDLNQQLYDNPEIAFQETRAAAWLTDLLDRDGFTVERKVADLDTAFRATFRDSSREGATVAFLAEYDALPKLGHACCHNMIGMGSVGAAMALRPLMKELDGTVQVLGTPAEEGGGGKVIMAEAGLFDQADVAMMVHPWNVTASGANSLARIRFDVEFKGKPAHSFMHQEEGSNALAATIQTFNGINALREHLRPHNSMVHGIITHGGEFAITVPDYSAASIFIMTPEIGYAREVYEKMKKCAEGAAIMTGTEVSFHSYQELKHLIPNLKLAEAFDLNLERLGFEIENRGFYGGVLCATDVGDVSHIIPTIQPYLRLDKRYTWHTPEVARASVSEKGEALLLNMAKVLAMTAVDILTSPDLFKAVQEEFRSTIGQRERPEIWVA